MAEEDRASRFAAAARRSRWVRILRFALPAAVLLGGGAYFALSSLRAVSDLPFSYDDVVIDRDTTVIERPRLTGYQAGGEAYTIAAARAIQNHDDPDQLTLEAIDATLVFPSGETARFVAPAGSYNTRTGLMELRGGLTMSIGETIAGTFQALAVEVPTGTIRSRAAFEIAIGAVTLNAQELDLAPGNIRAAGGVRTVFAMASAPAAAAAGR